MRICADCDSGVLGVGGCALGCCRPGARIPLSAVRGPQVKRGESTSSVHHICGIVTPILQLHTFAHICSGVCD